MPEPLSEPIVASPTGGAASAGAAAPTVTISVNMGGQNFTFEGGNATEDERQIIDVIMGHMDEVSESVAMQTARALLQIFPNMPLTEVG